MQDSGPAQRDQTTRKRTFARAVCGVADAIQCAGLSILCRCWRSGSHRRSAAHSGCRLSAACAATALVWRTHGPKQARQVVACLLPSMQADLRLVIYTPAVLRLLHAVSLPSVRGPSNLFTPVPAAGTACAMQLTMRQEEPQYISVKRNQRHHLWRGTLSDTAAFDAACHRTGLDAGACKHAIAINQSVLCWMRRSLAVTSS